MAGLQQAWPPPVLHDVADGERIVCVDVRLTGIEIGTVRDDRSFDDQVGGAHEIGENDRLVGRDDDPFEAAGLAQLKRNRRLALGGRDDAHRAGQ